MAKSQKTCMEQAEIIDTFGTYQTVKDPARTVGAEPGWSGKAEIGPNEERMNSYTTILIFH